MSNSLSNTFVPAQYPFRLPDLQALVFWPGSAPATLIRIVIAGACLGAFAAPADAAPEPYSRVQLESSIASSPTAHTEIERLVEYAVTLDVPAETIEFGASEGIEAIRAFDLADASSDGASFLIQSETQTNGCEGDPPCPEPLSIANGYLTLADLSELYRPKGLLAPNAEFFVGVQAFEGRAQGEPSYVGFEALLAKPAALSSVDLLGTYLLATYSNQLGRDFVGGTSEIAGVSTVNITFNGDGSCSGSQIVNAGVLQRTDWPMLNSEALWRRR